MYRRLMAIRIPLVGTCSSPSVIPFFTSKLLLLILMFLEQVMHGKIMTYLRELYAPSEYFEILRIGFDG